MGRLLAAIFVVTLGVLTQGTASAQTAPACQFILGFKTLHDLASDQVGNCIDNQAFAPNGDAQQHTTKGLMAWRKADNWTAFTNGYMTWINGPNGLVSRLNTDRFPFEASEPAPQAPAPPAPPAAAAPSPSPTPGGLPANVTVMITDTGFVPDAVYIQTGGTVTWINRGNNVHSVTAISAPLPFDSGGLGPGGQTSFQFRLSGSYGYDSSPDCILNTGTPFVCKTYTVNASNPS
jgi:plastocyanin